jgi:hypothetical protein
MGESSIGAALRGTLLYLLIVLAVDIYFLNLAILLDILFCFDLLPYIFFPIINFFKTFQFGINKASIL